MEWETNRQAQGANKPGTVSSKNKKSNRIFKKVSVCLPRRMTDDLSEIRRKTQVYCICCSSKEKVRGRNLSHTQIDPNKISNKKRDNWGKHRSDT